MEALTEVVRAGKARYIGFSEWSVEQIQAALDVPGVEKFVSSQPQYSLLWRKPEREIFPLCARNGISQIVWSPLAQGVLTGKYRPADPQPAGSRATSDAMGRFMDRFTSRPVLEAVERLRAVAEEAGLTLPQLALGWVLREPNLASAIVGASRPEQVESKCLGVRDHAQRGDASSSRRGPWRRPRALGPAESRLCHPRGFVPHRRRVVAFRIPEERPAMGPANESESGLAPFRAPAPQALLDHLAEVPPNVRGVGSEQLREPLLEIHRLPGEHVRSRATASVVAELHERELR